MGWAIGPNFRPTLKVATCVLGDAVKVPLAQAAPLAGRGEDAAILTVLGAGTTIIGNQRVAARPLEKALALDPNSAWAWNRSGCVQSYLDRPEVATEHFERSLPLSPFDPMKFNAFIGIGAAHFVAGRYADTVHWQEKGATRPARHSLGVSHRCLAGRTKREPIFRDCSTSTRT